MSQSRKKLVDVLTQWHDVHLRSRVDVSFLDVTYRSRKVAVVKWETTCRSGKTLQR
jgi:hypothetical protein